MLMSVSDIGTTATGTGQDWLLPALLVLCLVVIAVLAVAVVRQRRLIGRKNDYLVRYIGQYLSLKYKEFPEKGFSEKKLTQLELIEIMHLLKKMIYGCVLLLPALPAAAQDRTDARFDRTDPIESTVSSEEVEKAFFLRADLLRWATLTPDVGVEWRFHRSWSIGASGSWTAWSWDSRNRRYALWEVMPELRYYMGKEKRGYLGAMFKAGDFNYKFSRYGKQGDLTGGGLTGGYQLRLNDVLSMDFTLAVGCLHTDYDRYEVVDGVRVCRGSETGNWWGPIQAGVTLVWKIF